MKSSDESLISVAKMQPEEIGRVRHHSPKLLIRCIIAYMKISVAQIDVKVGDSEANLKKMSEYVERAAEEKADVIVFPEMSDTGYLMSVIVQKAEKWDCGIVLQLQHLAKQYKIHIVAGLSERSGNKVFNAIASIDIKGKITAKYRKTHLVSVEPMVEHKHLSRGNELIVAKVYNQLAGFMTCYEVRFPEIARCLTLAGATIIFLPAAFPLSRIQHWETLVAARAIENQVFVVAANRVGKDGPGLEFGGTSMIVTPYGEIITHASKSEETLVSADIDFGVIAEARAKMDLLKDRQPELYSKKVIVVS